MSHYSRYARDRDRDHDRELDQVYGRDRHHDRSNFTNSKPMSMSETKLYSSSRYHDNDNFESINISAPMSLPTSASTTRRVLTAYYHDNNKFEPISIHTPMSMSTSPSPTRRVLSTTSYHDNHNFEPINVPTPMSMATSASPTRRVLTATSYHEKHNFEPINIPTPMSMQMPATVSNTRRVLVGCTGSVATIKLSQLVTKLIQRNCEVRVVVTEKAKHFLKDAEIPAGCQVLSDTIEWAAWQDRGDPVVHIDLSKWADVFLIAPLGANSMAKLACGICDNLLTCVARAWDVRKPLLFCPAMNTKMWEHPVTAPQVALLKSWGYKEIPCISKTLMCGDTGNGAMAEVDTIVQATLRYLNPWDPYLPSDSRR